MNRFFVLTALSLTLGCEKPDPMDPKKTQSSESSVQLFNEAVLGSSPTDALPVLLSSLNAEWSPRQVVLDYKDGVCYGAMIHYDRSRSFESMRSAINARFGKHEQPDFAADPTMGIWRMDDAGFTIQLSDDDEEDSYMAIYVQFVDPATMAIKLEELNETEPELFEDFPFGDFVDALREDGSEDPTTPDGVQALDALKDRTSRFDNGDSNSGPH